MIISYYSSELVRYLFFYSIYTSLNFYLFTLKHFVLIRPTTPHFKNLTMSSFTSNKSFYLVLVYQGMKFCLIFILRWPRNSIVSSIIVTQYLRLSNGHQAIVWP